MESSLEKCFTLLGSLWVIEIIPFLVSIVIEAASPLTEYVAKALVRRSLKTESTPDHVIKLFEDNFDFSYDLIQVFTAFVITFATAITLPFFKMRHDVGIPFAVVMLIGFGLTMLYFMIANPSKHATRKLLVWSGVAIVGIILNVVVLCFFLVTEIV